MNGRTDICTPRAAFAAENAIVTLFYAILSLQKSMGGIAIDIWEKSNFLGSIGSQKGAKNEIFLKGGHLNPSAICRENLNY